MARVSRPGVLRESKDGRPNCSRLGSRGLRMGVMAFCSLALLACRDSHGEAKVTFGVFFGGQVQQRDRIEFELDTTKQTQGFRVELTPPAERARKVSWELTKPERARNRAGANVTAGDALLPAGQAVFEQDIEFSPGDPLGLWNIRVLLDDQLLLDRPFLVYEPSEP